MNIIHGDYRSMLHTIPKTCLTITDPPYNIGQKYDTHNDKLSGSDYIALLKDIPIPCVVINYPEETMKYVIPALGIPDNVMIWVYNAHCGRAARLVSFFGITPDKSKVKIPYRNPKDKRVAKLISNGSCGTNCKDWMHIEQVKNVSREYQGYTNQIPEKLITNILKMCEGNFESVFDPFMGSGTTLFCAKAMGYEVYGADISKKAYELTINRLVEVKA